MLRKNVAGQFVYFAGVNATTGAALTGATFSGRRCIDGTFAAIGGTITEDTGTGFYKVALAQVDTNGNDLAFFFTATNAVPVCMTVLTTAADPSNATTGGLGNLDAAVSTRSTYAGGAVASVTGSVGSVVGHTPQTGDTYGALGAIALTALKAQFDGTGLIGVTYPATQAQATDIQNSINLFLRNKRVLDPSTGIETIYDDAGAPRYTRSVYEDAAGTVPYDGTAAPHRVERYA